RSPAGPWGSRPGRAGPVRRRAAAGGSPSSRRAPPGSWRTPCSCPLLASAGRTARRTRDVILRGAAGSRGDRGRGLLVAAAEQPVHLGLAFGDPPGDLLQPGADRGGLGLGEQRGLG